MTIDLGSHYPHRGGRLLDAMRRAEAAFGQPPTGPAPDHDAAETFLPARAEPARRPTPFEPAPPSEPSASTTRMSSFAEPQMQAPPSDPYVENLPADLAAAMPGAIQPASLAHVGSPRVKLNLPRWPEIENLAKTIVGDLPELVSAVLACASINRPAASSLIAAPLARALAARQDEQVLLIEFDLYASLRATATLYQPKPGLAEVFSAQIAWTDAVLPTAIERLAYLPAGLDARAFPIDGDLASQLFAELKGRYRYVVIDAGPAAEALTAGWLARCDEVYLAVELERTSPRLAREVSLKIAAAGGTVRGAVVLDTTS